MGEEEHKNKKRKSLERVDKLLVDQGLARSRTHAQALIMAGQVCAGDQLIEKSSETFDASTQFRLKEGAAARYVSRGGEKLEGALKTSGLKVDGLRALDVGISTGGFTDCMLQHGVREVVGLDVGHNQLAWKIKNDPRVKSFEGVNARQIPPDLIGGAVDLVVIDVSFISLTLVLPEALKFLKPGGHVLALIKPQFEVQKEDVGKGGIVKDPLLHQQVQEKITKLAENLGLEAVTTFQSPIEGTDGNKEFFIFARRA
jgi:23S rRNA (cytidine1920-2'-O)/16S rRNA (cytidine1409-2'-O)-methyltransferase